MSGEVVARALAAACGDRIDRAVLDRLGGTLGAAARRAVDELATLQPMVRVERRATWAAIARAPVPSGIRGAHPSWIEAALVELPPRARAGLGGATDPVAVWLARWACAEIPPLP